MEKSLEHKPNLHVRTIFRIIFDSSHFILQIANMVSGSKYPLRWVSVAEPDKTVTTILPANLIANLDLPNGNNLISRTVQEEREVVMTFASRLDAKNYAMTALGLTEEDEANDSMDLPIGDDRRPWYLFWKL